LCIHTVIVQYFAVFVNGKYGKATVIIYITKSLGGKL
jgi:hypothetical protein